MDTDILSLAVISGIAVAVPVILGLTRAPIADVVGLIIGGIIFGPHLLGWITVDNAVLLVSQLGLAMLFLMAGLEIDPRTLRSSEGKLGFVGWCVSFVVAVVVGLVLHRLDIVDDSLGVAIALTSTSLGALMVILRENGLLNTQVGAWFRPAATWGEIGPILAIAILLGTGSVVGGVISVVIFLLLVLAIARVPERLRASRIAEIVESGSNSSAQTGVRIVVFLLIGLLALAGIFGIDTLLGAFAAGMILRRYVVDVQGHTLMPKLEGLAFGFLVPIFFVVSGANLDLPSILADPRLLVLFTALLVLVRGLPQFVLYRKVLPDRPQRAGFALLVATGLPVIVAVTTLRVERDLMTKSIAAALVGAGVITMLVFPLLGSWLVRKGPVVAMESMSAGGERRDVDAGDI